MLNEWVTRKKEEYMIVKERFYLYFEMTIGVRSRNGTIWNIKNWIWRV